MRIIHDIEAPAAVSGGTTLYARKADRDLAEGFRVEILISVGRKIAPFGIGEAVHLEGDGAYLLSALRSAVRQIEMSAALHVENGTLDPAWYQKAERGLK